MRSVPVGPPLAAVAGEKSRIQHQGQFTDSSPVLAPGRWLMNYLSENESFNQPIGTRHSVTRAIEPSSVK